jgi:hypothetical protein
MSLNTICSTGPSCHAPPRHGPRVREQEGRSAAENNAVHASNDSTVD